MGWILLFAIFILLILAVKTAPIEEETKLWIKISGFYFLSIVSFNIGVVRLPLGVLIGLYLVNRKPVLNKRLKNLTLFFGFVCFILLVLLPPVPVQDLLSYRENFNQLNRFEEIKSMTLLSPVSPEQDELIKFAPNAEGDMNLDYCIVIFRSWALKKKNVTVQDFEWIWSQSDDYLKFKDSYYRINDLTAEGYMEFEDGRKYFALFKKKERNGAFYLTMVVQHDGVKSGQGRYFPF
ncbi:hypothetical protein [Desulfolucanica intricata]|uniref:hypothetical protein n=1 Tax=Desulfolucanica intricata TaxID=1285191 RepID=UPI00082FA90D|nr:hypothetical protein [Desulfolucanica intricata]